MSDETLDVLIGVYLIPDLAKEDFDGLIKLIEDKSVTGDGVVLVSKDEQGELHVTEAGDHLGRRGATVAGGVGLVVGLFSPPLLAATAAGAAVGAVAGKFASHRIAHGIGDKMDDALPPGSAGVIAVYDHADAEGVDKALANAVRKSAAQIDKASAKELKGGLEQAAAGLAS
jgi:arylsulfatase